MNTILLLLLFFPFQSTAEDCQAFSVSMPIDNRVQGQIELAQKISQIAAAEDLKSFCEWNRMARAALPDPKSLDQARAAESQRLFSEAAMRGDKQGAIDAINNKILDFNTPWPFSMLGEASLKKKGMGQTAIINRAYQKASRREVLSAFSNKIVNSTSSYPLEGELKKVNDLQVPLFHRMAVCGYLNASSAIECSSGLNQITTWMAPHRMGDMNFITAAAPFKRVTTDPVLTEGLRLATVKLLSNVEKNQNLAKGSNLFSDLKESFEASGLSAEEALNATFDTLAALSVGGPNTGYRFKSVGLAEAAKNPNILLMTAIAEAIPHLDTLAMSQNPASQYSLPGNVDFQCDSGKNYHFWMAAYLSRELRKKGYSAKASASAAYASALGYQLNRNAGGEQIDPKNLLRTSRFGPVENGVRIDLTLAAAGAKFGSSQDAIDSPLVDLNSKFVQILRDGDNSPLDESSTSILGAKLDFAQKWSKAINAKGIFGRVNQ